LARRQKSSKQVKACFRLRSVATTPQQRESGQDRHRVGPVQIEHSENQRQDRKDAPAQRIAELLAEPERQEQVQRAQQEEPALTRQQDEINDEDLD